MTRPLDPAGDPDRFDASSPGRSEEPVPAGPLDPAADPDRFQAPDPATPVDPAADPDRVPAGYGGSGEGQTLTGLLGEGAQEEKREGLTWLFGLLAVIAFLILVSLLVRLGH